MKVLALTKEIKMIKIVPTNATKFDKAINDILEGCGKLQTCGVPFNIVFPCVSEIMKQLDMLMQIRTEFQIEASGRGRAATTTLDPELQSLLDEHENVASAGESKNSGIETPVVVESAGIARVV
jgi:hypothetical protein